MEPDSDNDEWEISDGPQDYLHQSTAVFTALSHRVRLQQSLADDLMDEDSEDDDESDDGDSDSTIDDQPTLLHPLNPSQIPNSTFIQKGVIFHGKQIFVPTSTTIPSTAIAPSFATDPLRPLAPNRVATVDRPEPVLLAQQALQRAELDPLTPQSTVARLRQQARVLEVRDRILQRLHHAPTGPIYSFVSTDHIVPAPTLPSLSEIDPSNSWQVKVYITTSITEHSTFKGIMYATGVPSGDLQTDTLVSTAFSAEVIDLQRSLLWTGKWSAKKSDDLEYFSELGPFKNLRDDLKEHCDDIEWLQEHSKGFVHSLFALHLLLTVSYAAGCSCGGKSMRFSRAIPTRNCR